MSKVAHHGLVGDLWPNIRLMQGFGHFIFEYHDENSGFSNLLRKIYSSAHLLLILVQFLLMGVNAMFESDDSDYLAENVITMLFFTHCITKNIYCGSRNQRFYRTLASWNNVNSHPLFSENNARHRAQAVTRCKKWLMLVCVGTAFTVVAWTTSTFFGDSTRNIKDPNNMNETMTVEIPRLMLRAWYPWDASAGITYVITLAFQFYFLLFTMSQGNLLDLMFCSWLIHASEQLVHVKEILKPLIDLSSALDTYNPSSPELFRSMSGHNRDLDEFVKGDINGKNEQLTIRGIYSTAREYGLNNRINSGALNTINGGIGPNGLDKKQEVMVRSAIKYWVERHKHIVRYVGLIGDAYGVALLLHMLTSTISLTLLAYQATRIDSFNLFALSVIGYLVYALMQIFAFCIQGNQLIEESSSVMEAAYSCQWYDGSEEAKTFVQIVCQQCQKALTISGAKFFTISLDLFASVLGAFVTYFMVLVQLK